MECVRFYPFVLVYCTYIFLARTNICHLFKLSATVQAFIGSLVGLGAYFKGESFVAGCLLLPAAEFMRVRIRKRK